MKESHRHGKLAIWLTNPLKSGGKFIWTVALPLNLLGFAQRQMGKIIIILCNNIITESMHHSERTIQRLRLIIFPIYNTRTNFLRDK